MNKTIAFLIESELEKAEVVIAARSISDTLQKMAENAAKMEAEDLMPLIDPIREHFGPAASTQFSDAVTEKLRNLVQVLSETRNAVSDEIARLQGEEVSTPVSDLDNEDFDMDDQEGDSDLDAEIEPEDAEPETSEGDSDIFDFDKPEQNAAGRIRKESVEMTGDRAVMREYANLIRSGKNASQASEIIMESYGIDLRTLVTIVESAR